MGYRAMSSDEDLVLKSYGFLDPTTLKDLTFSLEKEFLGKTKNVPPRLHGLEKADHNRRAEQRALSDSPPPRSSRRPAPLPPGVSSKGLGSVPGSDFYARKLTDFRQKLRLLKPRPVRGSTNSHTTALTSSSLPIYNTAASETDFPRLSHVVTSATPSKLHRKRQTRSPIDQECVFCNLPLQNTLSSKAAERVIELHCSHQTHEQCLLLEMEAMGYLGESRKGGDNSDDFPECPVCKEGRKAIPSNPETAGELSAKVLFLPKEDFLHTTYQDLCSDPGNVLQKIQRKAASPKPTHVRKHSRGSSVTANLSTFSSASVVSPSSPDFDTIGWSSRYSISSLKEKFSRELQQLSEQRIIHGDVNLSPSLMSSFGGLRLCDKLSISTDSKVWSELYCYLFEHMLVLVDRKESTFKLVQMTSMISIETLSRWWISLQVSKDSDSRIFLSSARPEVLEKWTSALVDYKFKISVDLVTSTIRENEFSFLLSMAPENRADGGRGRQSPGANPRFYESTIKSLIFTQKPDNMIIVLNQQNPTPGSLVSITNIIKSLLLVRINITLIMCSTSHLLGECSVIEHYYLTGDQCLGSEDLLNDRIDRYQKRIRHGSLEVSGDSLDSVIHQYMSGYKVNDTTLIVLSSSSLDNYKAPEDMESVLIEINSRTQKSGSRPDTVRLISWDDVMEVICSRCGLEFDDSDFDISTDEEEEDNDSGQESSGTIDRGTTTDQVPRRSSLSRPVMWGSLFNDIDRALKEAHKSMEKYISHS
ncbi:DEKNAAC104450 [Brettanomyces naardenensis]|uniref:DEKNAAC104450 n=1 Tax=Brettanomyces naardenensis TaxID=13370 RepID=A0A448YQX0_BRENA|nr:DEKNAAC104450 [Brettanomyces naardenensis]